MMDNFYVLTNVDLKELKDAVINNDDELWNVVPYRKQLAPVQSEVDEIIIHGPDFSKLNKKKSNMLKVIKNNKWWEGYYKLPVKQWLMALFQDLDGEGFGRCFISRLKPGSSIGKHTDSDTAEFCRFHFTLKSSEGMRFHCGDEVFEPKTGDIFWFDNQQEHWVENLSHVNRYTMVVDIKTPMHDFYFSRKWQNESKV